MALHGNDVSNYQTPGLAEKMSNESFVIVKASEGSGFVDRSHDAHVASARANGLLVGHYHFAHANGDAATQAAFFIAHANPAKGDVVVLDFEPYNQGVAAGAYAPWIIAFADKVKSLVGVDPWLYLDGNLLGQITSVASSSQMARLHQLPLWKATYSASAGSLGGWPQLTAWQYSDSPIDEDTFYGTADDWHRLAVGGSGSAATKAPVVTGIQSWLNATVHAGLTVDGVFGPKTRAALNDYLTKNNGAFTGQTDLVTAIQSYLNTFSFIAPKLDVDGVFGPVTKAAVLLYVNIHNGGFSNASF